MTNMALIECSQNMSNATLTLENCFGQKIISVSGIKGRRVSISRENMTSGVYLMKLMENGGIIASKRLVISD